MFKLKGFLAFGLLSLSQALIADTEDLVRLIVKYKQSSANLTALKANTAKILNLPIHSLTPMAGGAFILKIEGAALTKTNFNQQDKTDFIIDLLRKNPEIAYAVKDRKGHFKPLPTSRLSLQSEPLLSHDMQWDEFKAPQGIMLETTPGQQDGAWAYTTGYKIPPVVIAVLDTGIESHPSLDDNLIKDKKGQILGWNFAANNHNLHDETKSYHGTHVVGTIAAHGNIMKGVGEYLKIVPVKIPDASGMFYESSVINAIYWAMGASVPNAPQNPYPAQVLNMSFGVDEGPGKEIDHCDQALQEALKFVRSQGAIVAVAAGNDNQWNHFNAPAVCNGTIKVAATGPTGLRAYYSNYGPAISFAAPGGDLHYGKKGGILSTVKPGTGHQKSGYDFFQGTSMASPHVAGVAGLVYAVSQTKLSAEKVEQLLYATTHRFGKSNDSNESCIGSKPCGHGILDAKNAVKAALAQFDVIFSAPRIDTLNNFNNEKDNPWQLLENLQSDTKNGLAFVYQKDGAIYAQSGGKLYHLNPNAYQSCEIIGFDGVGCYQ